MTNHNQLENSDLYTPPSQRHSEINHKSFEALNTTNNGYVYRLSPSEISKLSKSTP